MGSTYAIGLSGMQAAQTALSVSAHNVANAQTAGFKPQQVDYAEQPQGGVSAQVRTAGREGPSLEADFVAQLQVKNAFLANLAVFKAADQTTGQLIDSLA